MSDSAENQLPDELRPVVARLEAERLESDPLELDQLKRRALTRANGRRHSGGSMKSRLATIFTLVALVGGTGGALAVAGGSGGTGLRSPSAARSQYTPTKKNCKKGYHRVKNKCVKTKTVVVIKKKKPTPKHLTGPAFTGAKDTSGHK